MFKLTPGKLRILSTKPMPLMKKAKDAMEKYEELHQVADKAVKKYFNSKYH